jgi:hypothetical protein
MELPEFTKFGVPGLGFSRDLAWKQEEMTANSMEGSGQQCDAREVCATTARGSVAPASNCRGVTARESARKGR